MRGVVAVLAVSAIVEHEDPAAVRGTGRLARQNLDSAAVDFLVVPSGLGQEELQALHRWVLRTDHRLRPGQCRQRLVPILWSMQTGQILA